MIIKKPATIDDLFQVEGNIFRGPPFESGGFFADDDVHPRTGSKSNPGESEK